MIQQKSLDWAEAAPERSLTLPARYFYDPKVFEAERERIFYPAWHCVAHLSELAEPGQFVTFDILDQSVIVSNHEGKLHAFHNACQHRGNRLINERRGKTGPVFGANGNVVKFKPAVNVGEDEIVEIAELFAKSLAEVEATL